MAVIINGTSGITNVNGSASTPAETGTDTDTGIYYGTNTVGLATNGTNALFIDASQNVGIGTTSPSAKLHVFGTEVRVQQNAGYYSLFDTAGTRYGYIQGGSGYLDIVSEAGSANTIRFTTNSSERMRVDPSGNVGIGTNSPADNLHVYANSTTENGIRVQNANASGQSAVQYYNNAGTQKADVWWNNNGSTFNIRTLSTDPLIFYTNNTERMRIDSSGNVGINITTPSTYGRLAVDTPTGGNGVFSINNSVGGGGGAQASFYYQSFKFAYMDATLENGTPGTQAGRLVFATSTGGTLAERMRIDSSGNLLLNTTTVRNVAKFSIDYNGASNQGIVLYNTDTGSGSQLAQQFYRNGSVVGQITTTNTATAYATSSDYRLKNTITPMTGALAKVQALKPVTYKWNADDSDGEGFIAHELAEVCPHAVSGEKDEVDDDGNPVYQGIDVSFLVATLTAAIQEQQAIIQQLQADVATLKGQA